MVYGDNKPFNVALVVPDRSRLSSWSKEHGIETADETKLFGDDRVQKLFSDQLEQYSSGFKQFEKIRKFALIGEDFTIENDMLTPKMSLKRRVVLKNYGETLERLYS